LKPTINLVMPDDVLNKIKYLCQEIPKEEWSGILLYQVIGTIKRPSKMKIILKDIIPMHKGTSAYTEYSFNEKKRDTSGYVDRHIDYTNENEEALEWHIGHIHSHNIMRVFFSGTDMDELDENSESHNMYLSLIVNNFMDFTAKVAFRAETHVPVNLPYVALDENGNEYLMEKSQDIVTKTKMYMYDCNIKSNVKKVTVDERFSKSVGEIIESAKPKTYTPPINNVPVKQSTGHVLSTQNIVKSSTVNKVKKVDVYNQPATFIKSSDIPFEKLEEMFPDTEDVDLIETFCMALLCAGSIPDDKRDLVEVLEELSIFEDSIDTTDLAKSVIDIYPAVYNNYFEETSTNKEFISITDNVINLYEEYEEEYPFLSQTIMSLKFVLKKFEENESAI